jgi:hypothetical protein
LLHRVTDFSLSKGALYQEFLIVTGKDVLFYVTIALNNMTNSLLKDSFGIYKNLTGNEGSGKCWWCGANYPDTHARRYCSEKCRTNYQNNFYWLWASNAALKRAGYRCQDCGVRGKRRLQVHHLTPLNGSDRIINALNRHENLIVLCKKCHRKRHQMM